MEKTNLSNILQLNKRNVVKEKKDNSWVEKLMDFKISFLNQLLADKSTKKNTN